MNHARHTKRHETDCLFFVSLCVASWFVVFFFFFTS